MNTWIALLRAIGGNNTLPSGIFVDALESVGAKDAKTYIATGNAVFRSRAANRTALAVRIQAAIDERRGFAPEVLLLAPDELATAIRGNPWRKAEAKPTTLHLTFLSATPANPDLAALERLRANGEQFALQGDVFYFHAPEGVGRSKLFSRVEKSLGVWGTARNWRTVCNVKALADEFGTGARS